MSHYEPLLDNSTPIYNNLATVSPSKGKKKKTRKSGNALKSDTSYYIAPIINESMRSKPKDFIVTQPRLSPLKRVQYE